MNTKDDAPLPKRSEEDHHFTNDGGKVWRESGTRPFTIDHKQAKGKEGAPWQPNDQDEAVDGTQQSGERQVMRQAYKDVAQGQQDTDAREQRGVEATVDKPFEPAKEPPEQKNGRT
ncbi:hypothetical protein [Noviherbaspirillum pedocola]|uniref:Uncharacterized protein n=1 Tax=Noviherbaspirillum pedocola TaxID=2801341 RepID=A0A934T210_9BURK|nr:hypothetical protein [Noviherbaspirillum pedocola]MBK4736283.1 hypothetical protein [Noviherbaspirillum pedocola]